MMHESLDSLYCPRSGENEIQAAAVDFHNVSAHVAQSRCPHYGAADLRKELRVSGNKLRVQAIRNGCVPLDRCDRSRFGA